MEQGKVRKLFAQAGTLLVLMGVTYYLIFRGKNIHHIINVALDADPLWIAAAVLIMTVYVFCGGWCIRILMSARHRQMLQVLADGDLL